MHIVKVSAKAVDEYMVLQNYLRYPQAKICCGTSSEGHISPVFHIDVASFLQNMP